MADAAGKPTPDDAGGDIVDEARERFELCETATRTNRDRYKAGIAFLAGDQWDPALKTQREAQNRPCLVMDLIGTHVNQAVNDGRQNKPAIKVHPVDDKGDIEVAEQFDGIIRHIERVSNADTAYETAHWCAVAGGIGYWRVLTEYADDSAFEQDIVIRRVTNPMSIYLDPDSTEQDGSDAEYGFVITDMPRKAFEREYPDAKCEGWPGGADSKGWYSDDKVRIAEYFRVVYNPAKLVQLSDGRSMFADDAAKTLAEMPALSVINERDTKRRAVEWYKLGGRSVIDQRPWAGRYIPIVRVVGNEIDRDGKIEYTGLVHRAMDPQRVYNYWNSVVTETVALAPKSPFIGAKGQFEGVENRWAAANTTNPAYLEYTPVSIDGTLAPAPQRSSPPTVPTGALAALQQASEDLKWVTGQHEASFGAQGNEKSGKAILARQREGDTATYHYLDNLSRGIRHTGRILVDLIPKVFDTQRVIRVLGEDGQSDYVDINPNIPQPVAKVPDPETGEATTIFNLGIGRYDVSISVGPSFGTKRLEAVDAMTAHFERNPGLWQIMGDLYLRNQDWPGAQDMADRVAKTIPPELRQGEDEGDDGSAAQAQMQQALQQASQQMQQLQAQVQQAQQLLDQADAEVAQLKQEIAKRDQDIETKVASESIRAESERYKADATIRIAELEATRNDQTQELEVAQAQITELRATLEGLSRAMDAIAKQAETPITVDPSPLIEQVAARLASAPRPNLKVNFTRQNGEIVDATIVPVPSTVQ